jgi:hypothetical protein
MWAIIHASSKLTNRPLLKGLHKDKEMHIVLDCPVEQIYSIMKQAMDVNMLSNYHNYFITNLVS